MKTRKATTRQPRLIRMQRRLQQETKLTTQQIAWLYRLAMQPHVGKEQ